MGLPDDPEGLFYAGQDREVWDTTWHDDAAAGERNDWHNARRRPW